MYAFDFLRAAKRASAKAGNAFSPAQLYLTCHGLDLALKAYLELRGQRADDSGTTMSRADLGRLLTKADACGLSELVRLTPHERMEMQKAALYYSEAVLEYPALAEALRGYPQAPDSSALLGTLTSIVLALREASVVAI